MISRAKLAGLLLAGAAALVGCDGSAGTRQLGAGAGSGGAGTAPLAIDAAYILLSADGMSGQESIALFGLDGFGALAPLVGSPLSTAGEGNRNSKASGFAVTPDRRHLLLAHNTSSSVESFRIEVDGQLTPVDLVALPSDPGALAVHPDGTRVYASLGDAEEVALIELDPDTGLLAHAPGSPYHVGTSVRDLAVDPGGAYLVTGHMFGDDAGVRVVALDAFGAPAATAASAVSLSNGRPGASVDFVPGGQRLLVLDRDLGVYVYELDAMGQLTEVSGSPFGVGGFASGLAVHPSGELVFVARGLADELHVLRVGASGQLAPEAGSPVQLGATGYQSLAASPSGRYVYLSNRHNLDLLAYEVDAVSGALTWLGSFGVPGAVRPERVPGPVVILD